MTCAEYADAVAADVDGCLLPDEQDAVAIHLAHCPLCPAIRRQQLTAKLVVRERAPRPLVPAALRERIAARLDVAAGERRRSRTRLVAIGAMAAVTLLALVPLLRPRPQSMLVTLADDVRDVSGGAANLTLHTEDVSELRRFYRFTGQIDFERSADDFSAAGLRLIGGAVRPLAGVPTTFTVYDSPFGTVVCRRFRVGAIALPEGGERLGHNVIYTVDGVTIAVMHLGDIICTLATNIPHDLFVRQLTAQEAL